MKERFNPKQFIRRNGVFMKRQNGRYGEFTISQELDHRMDRPEYVTLYMQDDLLHVEKTRKDDPCAMIVFRYGSERKHGSVGHSSRLRNAALGQWLDDNKIGYDRIPMIERRPGVWAEDR